MTNSIAFHHSGLGGFGRNKGILGFLGGAIFCIPFNYRLLSLAKFAAPAPAKSTLALASLAFGLAGAFADLAVPTPVLTLPKRILGRRVPPFHVDDNFVVPIFSGFACTQVFKALGWDLNLELSKFLLL
jgi:dolichol kinase